jgi:hypothetical protein
MPEPVKTEVQRVHRWYELDYLVPYRDVVLALGFFIFVTGVFLIPRAGVPLGLIALGAGLMYAAWHIMVRT